MFFPMPCNRRLGLCHILFVFSFLLVLFIFIENMVCGHVKPVAALLTDKESFSCCQLKYHDCHSIKSNIQPWLVWLSGLSAGLQTKGSLVRFLGRAHAWVAGQILGGVRSRGDHTLTFLSLSFSLPSPLSKNK